MSAEMQFSDALDRRHGLRFEMGLLVLLRTTNGPWIAGVSQNVSVNGAFILAGNHSCLTLMSSGPSGPPRLRGTEQPLVLQFFGAVLRCGVVNKENLSYGIASESLKSKYLPKEQAAKLDALFAQSGSSD